MNSIAVIGSRSFTPPDSMFSDLLPHDCIVISGGAKGVDSAISRYCKLNNIKIIEFLPDYGKYGKSAPIIRNKTIIDNADEVLAFWDGTSKGTHNAINTARKAGLNVTVISI